MNVRDAEWWTSETFGSGCRFESDASWFSQLAIHIRVLQPGEPNSVYHSESQQEAFLVLSGDAGFSSRVWSGFSGRGTSSSPAGTEHVFVGAGDGPCVM